MMITKTERKRTRQPRANMPECPAYSIDKIIISQTHKNITSLQIYVAYVIRSIMNLEKSNKITINDLLKEVHCMKVIKIIFAFIIFYFLLTMFSGMVSLARILSAGCQVIEIGFYVLIGILILVFLVWPI